MASFLPSKVYYERTAYRHAKMWTGYVDLLPNILHLRRNFSASRFDDRGMTIFKEVAVVPFEHTPHYSTSAEVYKTTPQRYETRVELLESLKTRLKEVVFETWKPGMAHAIIHSSGIDSRILSWTIKELHKEHGDEWLGKIMFLCSKWEADEFYRIMEYQGWKEEQYWVPGIGLKDQYYYGRSLYDFDGAWKRHDGVSAIPVNLFWYPVDAAQRYMEFPTKDVQLYTGQWGNTVFDAGSGPKAGAGIRDSLEMFYNSMLFRRPMKGDEVIHPFTDCELARLVASSKIRLGKKLRPLLLEYMDPKLVRFTNMMADGDRHRRIHDDIITKMVEDYGASWYGRIVRPGERPAHKTTEFQKFWSCWTAASLCGHLLRSGYEIKVID